MTVYKNDGVLVQEYVYDFAVDGGAISTINLSDKEGFEPLPNGAVVMGVTALVQTTATSGGSATVAYGDEADTDGYSGAAIAVASLTAGAVFNGWDNGAALLWDDTNDHAIYPFANTDAKRGVTLTIAAAALTAGKIKLMVHYMLPS